MTAKLFTPITIRRIEIPNRIMMSPMCQYSATDGYPDDWHFVHYASHAVGKVGLIMLEATAIEPIGRITPGDLGIWSDEHAERLSKLAKIIEANGSVPGIQIAHAGRKAGTAKPWEGSLPLSIEEGGWEVVGPSSIPFADNNQIPHELTTSEIQDIIDKFRIAAQRAIDAGFKAIEIHAAHGYLLHEFLSPLSNKRNDEYGGTLENRQRFLLEVAQEIRSICPQDLPVFVRISATDWVPTGWNLDDTLNTAKKLDLIGIDAIDVSSGGNVVDFAPPEEPGYQVPFSHQIKEETTLKTCAVGMITKPDQAETIVDNEKADIVALGRELLRNPYWPLHAAKALRTDIKWPDQYLRAKS